MIGKVFNNRYQIIEKLGAGGTSIVYRGQDLLLNRMVTIKILREEYAGNNDFVRRFRHEAQAVASLSHNNIVSVYDVGFEENMHYIVMEFVAGESLKEYIQHRGALKLNEACNIITQVLAGLQHAHEHGIVHRDIKPHNILLGKDARAKVTDFGIAVGMSDVTMTYNTSSRIMGSVHYISPEQVQGLAVTEKSDIYSAGVVFYEMLTGRLPYVGETPISIAMQHVQGDLVLPHQINPDVPMGISYVVMRAMRKNPEMRYEDARQMAEAVRAAYQGSFTPPEVMDEPLPRRSATPSVAAETAAAKTSRQPHKKKTDDEHRHTWISPGRIALLAGGVALVVLVAIFAGKLIDRFDDSVDKAVVPYVIGLPQAEAEAALEEQGLVPEVITRYSDQTAAGLVMNQSVAAEQSVSRGRTVEITVSLGEEQLTVPELVGQTQRMAELKLVNMGLSYTITEEYNEEEAKGKVMDQNPAAGTGIAEGGTVELIVSLGKEPEKITMPTLIGKTLNEARAICDSYEITIVTVNSAASYEYQADYVTAQSVAAGSETTTGIEVTLTVSSGPGPQSAVTVDYTYFVPILSDDPDKDRLVSFTVEDAAGRREVYLSNEKSGTYITVPLTIYTPGMLYITVDGQSAWNEAYN